MNQDIPQASQAILLREQLRAQIRDAADIELSTGVTVFLSQERGLYYQEKGSFDGRTQLHHEGFCQIGQSRIRIACVLEKSPEASDAWYIHFPHGKNSFHVVDRQ